MGVLGLTPFLQKNCPGVIKKLPDRLRSFTGKTIVIDGTLITQRLHFAPMPWDHRHILGWYKMIQELKESGVGIICVFDGQQRSQAKARETARRNEMRNLSAARGSIEVERLKRLRKFVGLVGECKQRGGQRERVSAALRDVVSKNARTPDKGQLVETKGQESNDYHPPPTDIVAPQHEFDFEITIPTSDLHDILLSRASQSMDAYGEWPEDPALVYEHLDFPITVSVPSSLDQGGVGIHRPLSTVVVDEGPVLVAPADQEDIKSEDDIRPSSPVSSAVVDEGSVLVTPADQEDIKSEDDIRPSSPPVSSAVVDEGSVLVTPADQEDMKSEDDIHPSSPPVFSAVVDEGPMLVTSPDQEDIESEGDTQPSSPPVSSADEGPVLVTPPDQEDIKSEDDIRPSSPPVSSAVVGEDPVLVTPFETEQITADTPASQQHIALDSDEYTEPKSEPKSELIHEQNDVHYPNIQYNQDPEPLIEEILSTTTHAPPLESSLLSSIEPPHPGPDLLTPDQEGDADFPSPLTETPEKDIPSALASLYLEYCQSIPKLASLSKSPQPTSSAGELKSSSALSEPDDQGQEQASDQMDYVMSRHQLQLTVDEGKVWDELVGDASSLTEPGSRSECTPTSPTPSPLTGYEPSTNLFAEPELSTFEDTAQATLISLAKKSSVISESYGRRNNPPTAQTYEECKEIIRAMGVPCLDSAGPYEAEALAASLVINGHADYVASEDTDVLVYEAPLIRNITNRVEPLTIVNGSDIRTVLHLSRESFIDFALLLGTDFSQRIKNVGPQRALKFIRRHGSIEAIIRHEPKFPPRVPEKVYLEQVEAARGVFGTLPKVPDLRLLKEKETNKAKVGEILQRYKLLRASEYQWGHDTALEGNYYEDNPKAF